MQKSTFRAVGTTFALLGFILTVTRSAAGIPFLVIGVTFLLIWWDQEKKGKKGTRRED